MFLLNNCFYFDINILGGLNGVLTPSSRLFLYVPEISLTALAVLEIFFIQLLLGMADRLPAIRNAELVT